AAEQTEPGRHRAPDHRRLDLRLRMRFRTHHQQGPRAQSEVAVEIREAKGEVCGGEDECVAAGKRDAPAPRVAHALGGRGDPNRDLLAAVCRGQLEAEGARPVSRPVLNEDDLRPGQVAEAGDQQPHRPAKLGDLVVDGNHIADARFAHRAASMVDAISCAGRIELRSVHASARPETRSRKCANCSASGSPVWRTNGMSITVSARSPAAWPAPTPCAWARCRYTVRSWRGRSTSERAGGGGRGWV